MVFSSDIFKALGSFGEEDDGSGDLGLDNDPFEAIRRMRTRYQSAGITPPEPTKSTSLIEGAFKVIDYPDNIVRGLLLNGVEGAKQAIKGEKTFSVGDKLREGGYGKKTQMLGGFVGDVLLSPTTYLGAGLVKNAGAKAMESGVAKAAGSKLAARPLTETAAKLGRSETDIASALERVHGPDFNAADNVINTGKQVFDGELTGQNMQDAMKFYKGEEASALETKNLAQRDYNRLLNQTAGVLNPVDRGDFAGRMITNQFNQPNAYLATKPGQVDLIRYAESKLGPMTGQQKNNLLRMSTTNPTQLNALLNIADMYGTKVKNYAFARHMAERVIDTRAVDKLSNANRDLLMSSIKHDDAAINTVFSNRLVASIDDVGQSRFIGIMLPNGKTVAPLVNITPIGKAASKVADAAYQKVPMYAALSDWWRKAVTGTLPRAFNFAKPEVREQAQAVMDTMKQFDRQRQALPQILNDFVAQAFGHEVVNGDQRLRRLAPYLLEINNRRGVTMARDPFTLYVISKLVKNSGINPGEVNNAVNHILTQVGNDGLQRIDEKIIKPLLDLGGQFTDEEVREATRIAGMAKLSTDTMAAAENLTGISKLRGQNENYVKHMYEWSDPNLRLKWDVEPGASGMGRTNPLAPPLQAREYETIAEAVAFDPDILRPMDDIMHLTSARMGDTIKMGMARGLVEGIDTLFVHGQLGKIMKGVKGATTDADKLHIANQTLQAIEGALGGTEGLKALSEVVRPGILVDAGERGSTWLPINNIFGLVNDKTMPSKYFIHKDLKQYLDLVNRPISDVTAMRQFLQFTDNVTATIKKFQTTYNLPFVPRNYIGEALMSFANGTSPETLAQAARVLSHIHGTTELNGKTMYVREALSRLKIMNPTDNVTRNGKSMLAHEAHGEIAADNILDLGNGRTINLQDLHNQASRLGLTSSGHVSEYKDKAVENMVKSINGETVGDKVKGAIKEGGVLAPFKATGAAVEHAAEYGDSLFRVADYIQNLKAGMTEAQAAQRVKMFHVDYQDLTQAERAIFRRIVPYYTFMRKNIPIQLRMMVERPGYYGSMGILLNNSYQALGDPATPDYLHKNLSLPLYVDDSGNTHYLNWNLPMGDLAKFRIPNSVANVPYAAQDTFKELVQVLHPGIKAPFELATGKNISFDTPIKPDEYLTGQLGGAGMAYKYLKEYALGETPSKYPDAYDKPAQFALTKQLFPAVNPNKEELARAYQYREEITMDAQKRKTETGEPIPELEDTYTRMAKLGVYLPNPKHTTPYTRNKYYWENKDWVKKNNRKFTP